jgi:hypothetical protein
MCASCGFVEFFKVEWLLEVLSAQNTQSGCYPSQMSNDIELMTTGRKLLRDISSRGNFDETPNKYIFLTDGCSAHAATQAAGVLCYTIAYLFYGPPVEYSHLRIDMQRFRIKREFIRWLQKNQK